MMIRLNSERSVAVLCCDYRAQRWLYLSFGKMKTGVRFGRQSILDEIERPIDAASSVRLVNRSENVRP